MALRLAALLKCANATKRTLNLRRSAHALAKPAPLACSITPSSASSPPLILPELDDNNIGFECPYNHRYIGGPMELMAVPKKKVSRHKRGIRNGPKALKPAQVIIRCKVCGRVKLPHFFCCSGIKEDTGGQS